MAKDTNNTPLAAGFICYLIWGFVPLAFQAIGHLGVGSWEILAHRTIWGAPTALIFVLLARQWRQVVGVFRNPRVLAGLSLSTALIATNWICFIWAVNSGHVLESSLGYYITPLINMAAGVVMFRERIDRVGVAAIVLAAMGVAAQALALGQLPWVSLVLAVSFGAYGIVRKQVAADAQTGLFVECLLLAIPSLAFTIWLASRGQGQNHADGADDDQALADRQVGEDQGEADDDAKDAHGDDENGIGSAGHGSTLRAEGCVRFQNLRRGRLLLQNGP